MKNDTKKSHRVIVIGGGIHGITSAIKLAQNGLEVLVVEKRKDILLGTSAATHNRAHLGYHYPRSIETAKECHEGLNFFKKTYPKALFYPREVYYLIEKNTSKTSALEFKKFCKKMNLPFEIIYENSWWNKKNIECGFKVNEPIFDLEILSKLLKKEAQKLKIKILTETELLKARKESAAYTLTMKNKNSLIEINADIILNATYAYSNNILKILNLENDMTKYQIQKTEVILVESKKDIPALTVMDGNYISIMPLANAGKKNLFLIYDVLHSVLEKKVGYFLDDTKKYKTNFKKMIAHGEKYYPFMKDLKFIQSNFGYRPIPNKIKGSSRKTRIIHHKTKPGIYSILEGKFISAPLIAEQLIFIMKKNKTIS